MRFILAATLMIAASAAQAQGFTGYTYDPPNQIFFGLAGQPVLPTDVVTVSRITPNGGSMSGTLPLSAFASSNDIAALGSGANSNALVAIASRLDQAINRFREGIALAGAINVLPPNPGDRFAVSFGGAGYDGAGAGSVALSVRIDESTLAYVGYARGPTQNLVKGGIGFSFR